MPNHFKVDDTIKGKDREELLALASDISKSVDDLHKWIRAKGYFIGRTAVYNWFRRKRRLEHDPLERLIRICRLQGGLLKPETIKAMLDLASADIASSRSP